MPFAIIVPPTLNCPVGAGEVGDGVLGGGVFVGIVVETFVGIAVGLLVEVELTELGLVEGTLDGVPPVFARLPLLPISVIPITAIKIQMIPTVRMSIHTGTSILLLKNPGLTCLIFACWNCFCGCRNCCCGGR